MPCADSEVSGSHRPPQPCCQRVYDSREHLHRQQERRPTVAGSGPSIAQHAATRVPYSICDGSNVSQFLIVRMWVPCTRRNTRRSHPSWIFHQQWWPVANSAFQTSSQTAVSLTFTPRCHNPFEALQGQGSLTTPVMHEAAEVAPSTTFWPVGIETMLRQTRVYIFQSR